MSQWGNLSYESDEIMDRVGDVWRNLFDLIPPEVAYRTIEAAIKEERSASLGLVLWKFCGIELSPQHIKRLGCLMTVNKTIGRKLINGMESNILDNAIKATFEQAGDASNTIGPIVSFFVRELYANIDPKLRIEAISSLDEVLLRIDSPTQKAALTAELLTLRGIPND